MTRVVTENTVTHDELDELLQARLAPVHERVSDDDPHVFELVAGPFDFYRRALAVTPDPADPDRFTVTTTTDYDLAIPIWGWMFKGLVNRSIKHPPRPGEKLWWLPPDTLDARASRSLSLLCALGAFAAYLGVLVSQLNTYFARDLGVRDASDAGISVRFGALLGLVVLVLADRIGRKRVLVASLIAASLLTFVGAFAEHMTVLVVSQGLARAFSAAVAVLAVIMAAEEMPANSRAFSISMLVMSGALGAGGVVLFLVLADVGQGWRLFFAVPILFIVPVLRLARRLPETRRYEVHAEGALAAAAAAASGGAAGAGAGGVGAVPTGGGAGEVVVVDGTSHLRRFLILGAGAVLFNVFLSPSGFYMNDFLKTEHDYGGGKIALMQAITNIPGGLSIIVGGYLADRYGRKIIGAIGAAAGVGFTVMLYRSSGGAIWVFSTLGTLIGAIAVPALGVYGPELFPTGSRGRYGGGLKLLDVVGAVVGLKAVALLKDADHLGSYGEAMTVLGIAPAILVVIILVFYPETANKELEELNPEDAPPPQTVEGLVALDHDFEEHHPDHHLHLPHDPADHGDP